MKGTAHRASTAHPAITFIGRLALAALILVVLVEVYFLARGFNLYREAIEEAGLDEMAASIQSSESFTPIDELPDLYLQAVVAVEDHRFYAHPGFDAIATARALVNDPALILADEPTGNLDTATGDMVLNTFKRLRDAGKTIVLITHEPDVAAHADRVVHIRDGRLYEGERA